MIIIFPFASDSINGFKQNSSVMATKQNPQKLELEKLKYIAS